jgi:hypothetical protein
MRFHHFLAPLLVLPFLLIGCGSKTESSAAASSTSSAVSDVIVTSPAAGATVTSPLMVIGEARGTWFFEASFPIRVMDDQGNQVGIGIAQAEGEWMTTDFVPFSAVAEFSTTASHGSLVFEKDNPSGDPENAAQVTVPVQF